MSISCAIDEVKTFDTLGHHPRIAHFEEVEKEVILKPMTASVANSNVPIQINVHADIGYHNVILDSPPYIKIIDFARSTFTGENTLVRYELCSCQPGDDDQAIGRS
ncbi:kinase-like protein [Penicillium viridicatum]|nr:kinase-like protein [Penicillium viridicatum]